MIDKATRDERLQDAVKMTGHLRQEDTLGGVLAFLATSPFNDADAAEYMLNALVATGTVDTLAKAYNIPEAAAVLLHAAAIANITSKKRPPKDAGSFLMKALTEALTKKASKPEASDDTPDPDCQCPGCKANRFMEDLKKHAVPDGKGNLSIAVEFGTKTPEEIKELNTRFMAEVGKGRSPVDVAQELGGRIANYDDVLKAEKEGRIQAWHVDGDGNPLH